MYKDTDSYVMEWIAAGYHENGSNYLWWKGMIQNVTISCDLTKTELFELGRRGPYHRFVDFPVEVTVPFN